ncbi:hypothetical protein MTBLM1_200001 [Rhodospirillaceae bacterium LM-1]|nr:hypothetical protein MTBLM1_200001 [Rhodospirillaceae bacterium LM-1]
MAKDVEYAFAPVLAPGAPEGPPDSGMGFEGREAITDCLGRRTSGRTLRRLTGGPTTLA